MVGSVFAADCMCVSCMFSLPACLAVYRLVCLPVYKSLWIGLSVCLSVSLLLIGLSFLVAMQFPSWEMI